MEDLPAPRSAPRRPRRGGRLSRSADFERVYRVGGQGEGQPFRFERASAEEFGAGGRILLDVRQHMMDTAGVDQTKTAIRAQVRGDNGKIDKALATLVSSPSEPVWSEDRGGGRIVYVWQEREVSDGLAL